ncbi:methyl-accepting chemotaxis protein [Massilia jejuensis]|uniref:Methyl-accepting chemotaxis protein n=1 Tax=Massilia jejuensis TaxID=648894 RepID=A0ABW0PHX6_9BURK
MFSSKMTIGARLALGFGAVLALMMVLTALAVSRVGDIDATLNRINDVNNVKQRHAINFRGSVHDRAIALRDVVLASDNAAAQPAIEQIRVLAANYERAGVALDAMFASRTDILADEKSALAAIKEAERKTQPLIAKVTELRLAGDVDGARTLLAQSASPAFVAWLASVNRLIDFEEQLNKDSAAEARALTGSFFTWMAILCAIAVAAGSLGAWFIGRGLMRELGGQPGYAAQIVRSIAAGDLGVRISTAPGDQSSLLFAMQGMRDSLVAIVAQVRSGTLTIANASTEIAAGNQDLSNRTENQSDTLKDTAASMAELTGTVRQNADNARQANTLAESASSVARKGGAVVAQVVETMASINSSSKQIVDIIAVIDGIAFQTNILALNAAVEAARAGEQGRGFAVVATEVRNLAQRSAAAAREIKTLIGSSVERVDAGARLVDEAGSTMEEIVTSVKRVTDIMAEISSASAEQSAGIEQVNSAIGRMDEATRQNATLVEQASAAAASLQDQAATLAEVVSVFKTEQQAGRGVASTPQRPALSLSV